MGRIIRLAHDRHAEARMLLPWYLTGQLDAAERAALEAHLRECPDCQAELRQEERLDFAVGSLQLDDLGVIDGWYWMRGTLEVQLAERASGKVRGNKRWEIKTSSQQKATATRRAMDEVDATLRRELRPAIIGFAVGN